MQKLSPVSALCFVLFWVLSSSDPESHGHWSEGFWVATNTPVLAIQHPLPCTRPPIQRPCTRLRYTTQILVCLNMFKCWASLTPEPTSKIISNMEMWNGSTTVDSVWRRMIGLVLRQCLIKAKENTAALWGPEKYNPFFSKIHTQSYRIYK